MKCSRTGNCMLHVLCCKVQSTVLGFVHCVLSNSLLMANRATHEDVLEFESNFLPFAIMFFGSL